MKNLLIVSIVLMVVVNTAAQKVVPTVQRVEPLSWWTGMKNPNVQLMVYGQSISSTTVSIDYPGVEVVKVHPAENKNFLFIDLVIRPEAKPGKVTINFNYGKKASAKAPQPRANSKVLPHHF